MTRALSLHLTDWSTDLVRRRLHRAMGSGSQDERACVTTDRLPAAIVLVAAGSRGRTVAGCCRAASRAGVRPGITLAHARALLPARGVHVGEHDPSHEGVMLTRLCICAQRFSPLVAADPPDGLMLDITGCERAFRGEGRLLRKAVEGLEWLGISARGAIAPTFGSAWALARFAEQPGQIIGRERLRDALSALPVQGLRIAPETALALLELGIETIGQVMDLPRASLPSRFGEGLLQRLDQALGEAMELIDPVRAEAPLRVERALDGATTRSDAIEAGVRALIEDLSGLLRARESGARAIVVVLGRVDSVPIRLEAAFSRPCRDARHLWAIIRPRLERANLGYGVEHLEITATRVGRTGHRQREHWDERVTGSPGTGRDAHDGDSAALVDVLSNRLGAERVTCVELVGTHIPERGAVHATAMDRICAATGGKRARQSHDRPNAPEADVIVDGARPSILFDRPEQADVIAMVPDGAPSRLRWRGLDRDIDAGLGPERIEPEWWRGADTARDYFRVRDSGGVWLWVFREVESARWFVHGLWA